MSKDVVKPKVSTENNETIIAANKYDHSQGSFQEQTAEVNNSGASLLVTNASRGVTGHLSSQESLDILLASIVDRHGEEDMQLEKLHKQINFFKNNEREISRKINNNEWYCGYYDHSYTILNKMRENWKIRKGEIQNGDSETISERIKEIINSTLEKLKSDKCNLAIEAGEWINKNFDDIVYCYLYEVAAPENILHPILDELIEKRKAIVEHSEDKIYEQYIEECIAKTIVDLTEKYSIRLQELPLVPHRTIVWSATEEFLYSGKTEEKTVYIPYKDIHYKLAESNWDYAWIYHNFT